MNKLSCNFSRQIKKRTLLWIFLIMVITGFKSFGQISPGELSKFHAHLEGMSKCTQCHVLGAKVENSKCLACHTEIKERIDLQKGYHSSSLVKGKQCASCHSDHHGKTFQIVRFDVAKFNHEQAGFKLEGAHSKKKCVDCHKSTAITNEKIKAKVFTYLGLKTECLACHKDYHQKTLPVTCANCHGQESFKPALKFKHSASKYQLLGKHQTVECVKCHKMETKEGTKFQKFKGIEFGKCTDCHKDVHQNKFGQNCQQCHTETSFQVIKGASNFDHSKTKYKLEDKHITVTCKLCHKTKLTDPLKHDKCTDCHKDFHIGQFAKAGISPDCSACHTGKGFTPSTYTIERHNQSEFKLKAAHLAAPCFDCHKKTEKWNFRAIGQQCRDCHKNIHQATISAKYYPNENCRDCHTENKWSDITFDHSKTDFKLLGAHATTNCRLCHFTKNPQGSDVQKFAGVIKTCVNCHADKHFNQFDRNGITNCDECHGNDNWKASKFDHNNTKYKLDGTHQKVACAKCHKLKKEDKYIVYQIKNYKCESCH